MKINKILECEANWIRGLHYLLPSVYRKIGIVLTIVSSIALILFFWTGTEQVFFKELTKALLLLSMLVISISKEKTEDEYTMSLRTKSYALAFIVGVLYTIFQPYINYGVDTILSAEKVTFTQLGSFPIIWFMLFVQLSFYHVLKYNR